MSVNKCEPENDKFEDEEEIEPKLKYVRVSNDLQNILCKDAASCIAVHPKFVCLGTHWGAVHLLDHQGNTVAVGPMAPGELRPHTVAVNQISVDANGDNIATCSDDGKVVVYGLYSSDNNQVLSLGRLVRNVALDPLYYKPGSGRRFITGDDKLSLHEKTFLGRLRSSILCDAEGPVMGIAWCGSFVAWACRVGVRVFDLQSRCSLGLINWEKTYVSDYRCNLRWCEGNTLLIGWVDRINICVIRKRSPGDSSIDLLEHFVDVVSTFKISDVFICGLGPLESAGQLVVLGYPQERDPETGKALRPVLCILQYRSSDYTEICTDSLTLRGYQEYSCNDYHLDCITDENRFFIVSPKDIVIASPYDRDDRVQWLVDHGKYEAAMQVLQDMPKSSPGSRWSVLSVGRRYLDNLLGRGQWQAAARLCLQVFKNDKTLWQEEVYKFARVHQLRSVSSFLPRTADCKLDPHIYEMVLYEYLKFEPQGFLSLVREWSHTLYNTSAVVSAVIEHLLVMKQDQGGGKGATEPGLRDADKNLLLEALAVLYSHEQKYDKALAMYLSLRHKDVFTLIATHGLHAHVADMLPALMSLDTEQALVMLMQRRIPAELVVKQLQGHQEYLYRFLDSYDKLDGTGQYHGQLVALYAVFCREKLLPFLRRSDNYPIQQALDVCKKEMFYPEMVYLLGRIGNTREALHIILHELRDVHAAVEFCQQNDDPELWDDLIGHALAQPPLIAFLLQAVGAYVDPQLLVRRIENGLVIPGLKQSLVKMMCDYNLQVSVQEGCNQILVTDYFSLHKKLVDRQLKGIHITDENVCTSCCKKIIKKDMAQAEDLVVFNCLHMFHKSCVDKYVEDCCPMCYPTPLISSYNK